MVGAGRMGSGSTRTPWVNSWPSTLRTTRYVPSGTGAVGNAKGGTSCWASKAHSPGPGEGRKVTSRRAMNPPPARPPAPRPPPREPPAPGPPPEAPARRPGRHPPQVPVDAVQARLRLGGQLDHHLPRVVQDLEVHPARLLRQRIVDLRPGGRVL